MLLKIEPDSEKLSGGVFCIFCIEIMNKSILFAFDVSF